MSGLPDPYTGCAFSGHPLARGDWKIWWAIGMYFNGYYVITVSTLYSFSYNMRYTLCKGYLIRLIIWVCVQVCNK